MKPTIQEIFQIIENQYTTWRHVRDLVCVHTFSGDYYINLCAYRENGRPVISVNVDNVKENINDLFDITYKEGSSEYSRLFPIYKKALTSGIQIASGSLAK